MSKYPQNEKKRLLIIVGEWDADAGLCADSWEEVLDKVTEKDFAALVDVTSYLPDRHFVLYVKGQSRAIARVCMVTGVWWIIPDPHSPTFLPDACKGVAEAVLIAGLLGKFVRHFKPYKECPTTPN